MATKEMPSSLVVEVLQSLLDADISVWIDGGWGIDALIGRQTRPHDDLDLVVGLHDVDRLVGVLDHLGFAVALDERPTRLELYDADGRKVGLHTVSFRRNGSGIQILQDGTEFVYRTEGFAGKGVVAGIELPCLSPEVQVECHLGYDPDEEDFNDMRLLAKHFGLQLPPPYGSTVPEG